ncbi:hypothetical protein [Pseudoalteromonas atlantica]|uniref:hypothetical protein n=1 Tax=Pseudoalteromonas atlantica TaxID=288 RepID=UPI000BBCD4E0|nr:hypothetical protein [Pseudoalteromonas atlantica]
MTNEKISFEDIKENYDNFIDSCAKFSFFTRSIEKQKEKSSECTQQINLIKSYKYQAIERNAEDQANHFFHMQCMMNAMKSTLDMWIKIKEDEFEKAWCLLIDAQEYVEVALKVADYEGIRNLESKLASIEHSIFPDWALYNSPGHTETIGKCSICHKNFAVCDHIENQIYLGKLCQRVDREIIEANHVALVKNPKDRRCIITKITDDDGKTLDYFTWNESDKQISGNSKPDEMMISSIIMSFRSLDFS